MAGMSNNCYRPTTKSYQSSIPESSHTFATRCVSSSNHGRDSSIFIDQVKHFITRTSIERTDLMIRVLTATVRQSCLRNVNGAHSCYGDLTTPTSTLAHRHLKRFTSHCENIGLLKRYLRSERPGCGYALVTIVLLDTRHLVN
jgi:hypothetical protein